MTRQIREIMTPDPVTVTEQAPIIEAAQLMRERGIGDVIVTESGHLRGVVTDRDLVIRALADQRSPTLTTVGQVCSRDLVTCSPQDAVDDAVRLMREHALRRLPVIEGDEVVGTVSLGDLAIDRDPHSALADISFAEPNR
ncbi:CBS domain-containing protein [Streptomyces brasiliensis]|uniref:Oxidoreductase n=1 Tax=Streptomyces brasiliensis TaxID=1954 RepID=A0A917NE39_9ACTN|nr:CBS domain-containing protein [Streptomyces brasiliensis]GGI94031.1 oxidoreductase [Streptomyces brasiliensis]